MGAGDPAPSSSGGWFEGISYPSRSSGRKRISKNSTLLVLRGQGRGDSEDRCVQAALQGPAKPRPGPVDGQALPQAGVTWALSGPHRAGRGAGECIPVP